MKKLRKSLAVLLAVIMLATFMPLFASAAAVAASKTNCVIVEYPQFSYTDPTTNKTVTTDATNTNITVPAGITYDDIELVGGKITYNDAVVEGYFEWNSRYLTRQPSIGVLQRYYLYFYPTDTTTYSRGTWLVTDVTGWPSITVDGIDCSIEAAPTVSGDLPTGNRLSVLTLSGGKVVDADGNDITANGSWSFVNSGSMPTESGPQDVQWIADGYDIPTTTVNVNVITLKATLAEAPVMSDLKVSAHPSIGASRASTSTASGGKVVDESGVEITGGTWKVTGYPEGITESSFLYTDTPVTVTWTCTGYESVTAQSTIHVTQGHEYYNIYAPAKLTISGQSLTYSPGRTWADDDLIIPGVIKDKNDNDVPGRWEVRMNVNSTSAYTSTIGASTSKTLVRIFFVPEDASLGEYSFNDSIGPVAKADFALSDDSVLVLNYGADHQSSYQESKNHFQFSTLKTVPEGAGVYSISWSKDVFDPATADYGSVTMVEVTVTPENGNYNSMKLTIPIKIQPYTITTWFAKATETSAFIKDGEYSEDAINGLITYIVNFRNTRLLGSVKVQATDGTNIYDIATVDADEQGKFFVEDKWQAPADGNYKFIYTYIPSENDSATFSEEKFLTRTAVEGIDVDMKALRTVTVKIGSTVYTEQIREGFAFNKTWSEITDIDRSVFGSWVFTDTEGNIIEIDDRHPAGVDYFTDTRLNFTMPEHDVVVTAKTASGEDVSDNAFGGSLWSFWQKLVNFIIEIYRTIVDFFVPAMENV